MDPQIPFSGCPLDRAEHERRDPEWIEAQAERDEARFLPLWRLQALVRSGDEPRLAWARKVVRESMDPHVGAVLLGVREGVAHFAVDLSALASPTEALGVAGEAAFEDVRALALRLPAEDAAIAGFARARVDWHARHGFCAVCGDRTVSRGGGAHRVCPGCSAEHFPRVDPVAIAIVIHGDRCLLGRQRGWPAGLFSALAGFVDQGESLEEAVRREVQEEAGLEVGDVRYVASQPWPFPSSLMVGCLAEARGDALSVDTVELEEARWFGRDEVRRALAGQAGPALTVPPPMAIAHHLMRAWLGD